VERMLSRRRFLRLAGGATAGVVLAACAPKVVEKEVTKVVKEVVKETVVVEGTPKVVEKEVTRVVKETVVVEPTPKAPAEPVELTMVLTNKPEDMEANLVPFHETHPNIKVKIIAANWEEFDDKVALLVAGGDAPALFSSMGKYSVTYHAARGLIPPLDPYLDRDNWNWDAVYAVDPDGNVMDGKRYAMCAGVHPTLIVYNKGLFDQAGVEYPPSDYGDTSWTWDEFISRMSAIYTPADEPVDVIWGWGGGMDTRYSALSFGADLFEEDDYYTHMPRKSKVTSEGFKWAYQMQQDFMWKYGFQPTPEASAELATVLQAGAFVSGKAGAQNTAPNGLRGLADAEIDYGLGCLPVNEYGPRGYLYASPWAMFKNDHQEESWTLLSWCVSDEGQEKAFELLKQGMTNLVTRGGWPIRKTIADKWQEAFALGCKRDPSTFTLIPTAIEYCHLAYGYCPTVWGELWDVAMKPTIDLLFLNEITIDEAVTIMEPKINEILAKAEK